MAKNPFLLLILLGLCLGVAGIHAQSARQLTRKIAPQPPAPAPANPAPKPPGTASSARPPAPPAPAQPTVAVRPPDPAKAKAQQEEVARKTLEFQKKRAAEGSPSAQYELGLRYLTGDGVEKNEAEGLNWLELSAKGNYTLAVRKLEELKPPGK